MLDQKERYAVLSISVERVRVFEAFLTFGDGPTDAVMVNNADWLDALEYIPFLRQVGQVVGMINESRSVRAVIQDLVADYLASVERLQNLLPDDAR